MNRILGLFTAAALCVGAVLPAAAEPANLLGVFGNWTAYTSGSGSSLTCYALSKPRATRPATAKRGSTVYLMVSDWPGRKVKAEPQIVYGYQAKEGGAAALGVGPDKFSFFIRNTGKDGSAWLQQLNDTPRLISAMGGGVSAVASGVSSKGTKTSDTYSLSGFNDAMVKVHAACNM
ncbi:MAG: hypothetical protein H0U98_08725 [Alphaproteobacteria bacterium]|nr:hypothetical protein [Alphaproteobacteria bacterium]